MAAEPICEEGYGPDYLHRPEHSQDRCAECGLYDPPKGPPTETELAEALELMALGWYDEGLIPEHLVADDYASRGLLETGQEHSGEGFCHLSKRGEAFVRVVLRRYSESVDANARQELLARLTDRVQKMLGGDRCPRCKSDLDDVCPIGHAGGDPDSECPVRVASAVSRAALGIPSDKEL
jgi:hypothetical protein